MKELAIKIIEILNIKKANRIFRYPNCSYPRSIETLDIGRSTDLEYSPTISPSHMFFTYSGYA